jgi:hypothetical protein
MTTPTPTAESSERSSAEVLRVLGRELTDDECMRIARLEDMSEPQKKVAALLARSSLLAACGYVRWLCAGFISLGTASRFLDTIPPAPLDLRPGAPSSRVIASDVATHETREVSFLENLTHPELEDQVVRAAANWFAEYGTGSYDADEIDTIIRRRLIAPPAGFSDATYEAIKEIVRGIELVDETGDKSSPMRSCLETALRHLSPIIADEVAADGPTLVYAERWGGR